MATIITVSDRVFSFLRWFFNTSPSWVDERDSDSEPTSKQRVAQRTVSHPHAVRSRMGL